MYEDATDNLSWSMTPLEPYVTLTNVPTTCSQDLFQWCKSKAVYDLARPANFTSFGGRPFPGRFNLDDRKEGEYVNVIKICMLKPGQGKYKSNYLTQRRTKRCVLYVDIDAKKTVKGYLNPFGNATGFPSLYQVLYDTLVELLDSQPTSIFECEVITATGKDKASYRLIFSEIVLEIPSTLFAMKRFICKCIHTFGKTVGGVSWTEIVDLSIYTEEHGTRPLYNDKIKYEHTKKCKELKAAARAVEQEKDQKRKQEEQKSLVKTQVIAPVQDVSQLKSDSVISEERTKRVKLIINGSALGGSALDEEEGPWYLNSDKKSKLPKSLEEKQKAKQKKLKTRKKCPDPKCGLMECNRPMKPLAFIDGDGKIKKVSMDWTKFVENTDIRRPDDCECYFFNDDEQGFDMDRFIRVASLPSSSDTLNEMATHPQIKLPSSKKKSAKKRKRTEEIDFGDIISYELSSTNEVPTEEQRESNEELTSTKSQVKKKAKKNPSISRKSSSLSRLKERHAAKPITKPGKSQEDVKKPGSNKLDRLPTRQWKTNNPTDPYFLKRLEMISNNTNLTLNEKINQYLEVISYPILGTKARVTRIDMNGDVKRGFSLKATFDSENTRCPVKGTLHTNNRCTMVLFGGKVTYACYKCSILPIKKANGEQEEDVDDDEDPSFYKKKTTAMGNMVALCLPTPLRDRVHSLIKAAVILLK